MSYRVDVLIACDEPSCRMAFRQHRTDRGGLNASAAAVIARSRGWQVNGAKARCPRHRRREGRPSLRAALAAGVQVR